MFRDVALQVPAFPKLPGTDLPDPFPYMVRILALASRISGYMSDSTLRDPGSPAFTVYQHELNDFNTSLPVELQFGIQTFQAYVPTSRASGFVLLHLWFHT
jgi:hypothetical protein